MPSKQPDEITETPVQQEIDAMRQIARALQGKDRETCARILDWAADHYAECVLCRVRKENTMTYIRGRGLA